jgi:hypothetical protein
VAGDVVDGPGMHRPRFFFLTVWPPTITVVVTVSTCVVVKDVTVSTTGEGTVTVSETVESWVVSETMMSVYETVLVSVVKTTSADGVLEDGHSQSLVHSR